MKKIKLEKKTNRSVYSRTYSLCTYLKRVIRLKFPATAKDFKWPEDIYAGIDDGEI